MKTFMGILLSGVGIVLFFLFGGVGTLTTLGGWAILGLISIVGMILGSGVSISNSAVGPGAKSFTQINHYHSPNNREITSSEEVDKWMGR